MSDDTYMILVDASMEPFPETQISHQLFHDDEKEVSHNYIFGPIQFTPITEDGDMDFYNGKPYAGHEYGDGTDIIGWGEHRIVVAKRAISNEQMKAIRMAYNNSQSDDDVEAPDRWDEWTDEYEDEDEDDDSDEDEDDENDNSGELALHDLQTGQV